MTHDWRQTHNMGVKMFDDDHAKLFEIIRALEEIVEKEGWSGRVAELQRDLSEYAQNHFLGEESLMRQHGYPDYERHAAEHRKTMRRIEDFGKARRGGEALREFMDYLKGWAGDHVGGSDRELGRFLNEKGIH